MLFFLNSFNNIRRALLVSVISMTILSCGSETVVTAGISGTGIVMGQINGFGSIFVNGVEYDIDDASFEVDGNTGTGIIDNGDLRLGMVVRLNATDNGDGTGVATNVVYEDVIEGPVLTMPATHSSGDTNQKQFEVLDLTVIINATTTTFEAVGFNSLAVDDVIEVSGFEDQNGNVIATRIEKTGELDRSGQAEVEIHGSITRVVSRSEILIGGTTVHLTNTTTLEDLVRPLIAGSFVEVQGQYQTDGTIIADEIEGEDEDRDEIIGASGEISLQGVITRFTDFSDFDVNGIRVDATAISSAITDLLGEGLEIEVDGEITDGKLVAEEIELRGGEASFNAEIKSVNTSSSSISIGYPSVDGEIILFFDSQSQLEDEMGEFEPFTFMHLSVGMLIKTEVKNSGNDWVVTSLKRAESPIEFEYELEGVVTETSGESSLTINGLVVSMDADAEYEIEDVGEVNVTEFFTAIVPGTTRVDLSDEDGDGYFDEAEID